MTEFKPMVFVEGVSTTVTTTNGAALTATALDIQKSGVMIDYLDNSVPKRVFRPWSSVASITQNIQE